MGMMAFDGMCIYDNEFCMMNETLLILQTLSCVS
jgi:hypothetical protein